MGERRVLPAVLYAAATGMELSYIYLGLDLFHGQGPARPSFLLIMALYPLAFLSRWLATRSHAAAGRVRRTTVLAGAVLVSLVAFLAAARVVSGALPVELEVFTVVVQVAFAGLAWWLGSSLLKDEVSYRHLSTRFQSGLLVMLALGAAGGPFLPALLFSLLGLIVLAVARWEDSLTRSPRVVQPFPAGVLLWSSLAVFAPGIALFLILSPGAAQVILGALAALMGALGRLFEAQPSPATPSPPWDFGISCGFKPAEEGAPIPSPLPPDGTPESPVVLWTTISIAYVAVLILVALAVRRMMARRRKAAAEVIPVESTRARVSLLRGIAGFFRGLAARLWHRLLSLLRWRYTRRGTANEGPATSVRSLYLHLLRLAEKRGATREPSQTPLEFLQVLRRVFPQTPDELELITRAYVRDRYSRQPLGEDGFRTARQAWEKVSTAA